jgi:hypothetical protein
LFGDCEPTASLSLAAGRMPPEKDRDRVHRLPFPLQAGRDFNNSLAAPVGGDVAAVDIEHFRGFDCRVVEVLVFGIERVIDHEVLRSPVCYVEVSRNINLPPGSPCSTP